MFHTDLDRGVSVISYDLNRCVASRGDVERLKALGLDLKLDFILNHLSVLSPQFLQQAAAFADRQWVDMMIEREVVTGVMR